MCQEEVFLVTHLHAYGGVRLGERLNRKGCIEHCPTGIVREAAACEEGLGGVCKQHDDEMFSFCVVRTARGED